MDEGWQYLDHSHRHLEQKADNFNCLVPRALAVPAFHTAVTAAAEAVPRHVVQADLDLAVVQRLRQKAIATHAVAAVAARVVVGALITVGM